MVTRRQIQTKRKRIHQDALDVFIARKLEVDALLQRLAGFSADDFGFDPENVDWGHVGTLGHYAQVLCQINASVFPQVEHAG